MPTPPFRNATPRTPTFAHEALVTGGTGFIGRHRLAELADRGFEVHVVGRSRAVGDFPSSVAFHVCDLLDTDSTSLLIARLAPTHQLHLAWYAKPGLFWTSLENLQWVAASLNLYLAFAKAGGTRAVIAGSCAEYDWSYAELDEARTPLAPRTLYGQSKHALRTLLEQAGLQTSVQLAWGRVFFLYGPHEASGRLVSSVIEALLEGREAHCSDGTQQRDFMHVSDVGRAFATVLDSDITGPVNIASGICVPVRSVVSILGSLIPAPELIRFGTANRPDEPPRARRLRRHSPRPAGLSSRIRSGVRPCPYCRLVALASPPIRNVTPVVPDVPNSTVSCRRWPVVGSMALIHRP